MRQREEQIEDKVNTVKCKLQNAVVNIGMFTVKFFKFSGMFINFPNKRLGKNKAKEGDGCRGV